MPDRIRFGVIGGTGVYQIESLADVEEVAVPTPFGVPSDSYLVGTLDGQRVAFLARHGRGHRISPTRLNQRANIYGFKMLGVEYLIGVSACGSLQEQIHPGDIVIPDQLFDRTFARPRSFFDDPAVGTDGLVVHVSVADPFCAFLTQLCYEAAVKATAEAAVLPPAPLGSPSALRTGVHLGGSFVTIEGPRFSTKAESRVFRSWGMDIIGMTTSPEAQLAREAEMSYAVMAHVTDYDVWHTSEEPVTVESVVRVLMHNAELMKLAVANAVTALAGAGPSPYADALKDAIITDRRLIPPEVIDRLEVLVGKYLR
jgi:5'-methylthioadenosine phosphorylase